MTGIGVRWLVGLGVLAWMSMNAAEAEPYLAVGQGYKCNACHTNPTGGGLRSEFGDIFAQNVMPEDPLDWGSDAWLGHIADRIRVGGDLRTDWSFMDVPHSATEKSFALEQVRAYADVSIIPSRLDLSVDEELAPGAATVMEAYAKYTTASGQMYVKAGKFYLPFGWRLQDNTALVREVTGISMTTPDTGVELGLELPHWSAQLDLTNGAANASSGNGQQVTAQVVWVRTVWRVGAAASSTQSDAGNRRETGLFAGLRTGPLVWLAEGDWVREGGFAGGDRTLLASLLELDWGFRKGHNLKLTYEYEDPQRSVRNNAETRASLVYEYTPIQFLQLRAGYRRYMGIPQSNTQNQTLAFLEVHVFF